MKKKKSEKESKKIIILKEENEQLQQELEAIKTSSGKYNLVASPLAEKQILRMLQRTPENHVFKRPGKGGDQFSYVTGTYMKKIANYTFGWLWDSEVVKEGIITNTEGLPRHIWVLVKLTINKLDKNGRPFQIITKTQAGGADVKYMKNNPSTPMNYSNDLKAAITDGIKKCLAELGIASDIYGKNEFKEIREDIKPEPEAPKQLPGKLEEKLETKNKLIAEIKTALGVLGCYPANTPEKEKQAEKLCGIKNLPSADIILLKSIKDRLNNEIDKEAK